MRRYKRVWESLRKYDNVLESVLKVERVWESVQKVEKVSENWENIRMWCSKLRSVLKVVLCNYYLLNLCVFFNFLIFIKNLIGVFKYFSILSLSLKKSLFFKQILFLQANAST